jgi:menaquinol-cytochrome c reductase iron-sulfur subunit
MATTTTRVAQANKPGETPMLNRRQFLARLSLGLSALGAALVGVPVVGFLLAPLLRQPPEQWEAVGPVDQFKVGEAVLVTLTDPSPLPWAGVAAKTAAWLRRDDEQIFVAFAVNCTHLGCPVRWLQDASLFMCPCHGGVFYKDGNPAAGPPPRPLTQYAVRVNNGQVEVLPNPVHVAG